MAETTQQLDAAEVRKVAKLARLKLSDADVARYATQLTAILDYVAQLKAVDVTGVEPMAHPLPLKNVLREDVVTPTLPVDAVLATVEDALRRGSEVSVSGFGKFHVGERGARQGVNPRTGERIQIAASRVPRFTAGSGLKSAVKGR